MILAVLATLGATVVAFVLYPVFAEGLSKPVTETGDTERELSDLEEKKNRLYTAITDLDFEKEAGKVSAADHEAARNDYLQQVAAVLARIDAISPKKGQKKKAPPPPSAPERKCASCARSTPASAKFCIHCGAAMEPAAKICASCGEKLPAEAKFCMACGAKVGAG